MRGGFVLLIMCESSVILLVHKLLKRSKSVNNKNSNILIQTNVKPVLTWPTKQTFLAHHTISDPHRRKSTSPTNPCNFDLSKIQLHSIANLNNIQDYQLLNNKCEIIYT